MKDVDYSKFYGERFCLKCEGLLQYDQIDVIDVTTINSEDVLKERRFRCKDCSELATRFDNPVWGGIKGYLLWFGIPFCSGIIILLKAFEDLGSYWLLIPVSLVIFLTSLGGCSYRQERKEIKLLVQKIASRSWFLSQFFKPTPSTTWTPSGNEFNLCSIRFICRFFWF